MKLSEYARKNSISYRTAYRHWQGGLIQGHQLPTGTIVVNEGSTEGPKDWVIYCRVSSHDQKNDLERQVQRLKDFSAAKGYQISHVYKEVASGVNDSRTQLKKALESGSNILVEHRDRLTRFGFNYIHTLLSMSGREIVVINPPEDDKDDLMQDFIAIVTSFCARLYGKRRSRRKTEKLIEEINREVPEE